MPDIPRWHVSGDWFDVCNCTVPCPCTFAQAPTEGECEGILAWHIREGTYGDVRLDDLNVVGLGTFEGNVWAGDTKVTVGMYMDERAANGQREALQMIFGGEAGGWPGAIAGAAVGRGFKIANNRSVMKQAEHTAQNIRSRSPLGQRTPVSLPAQTNPLLSGLFLALLARPNQ